VTSDVTVLCRYSKDIFGFFCVARHRSCSVVTPKVSCLQTRQTLRKIPVPVTVSDTVMWCAVLIFDWNAPNVFGLCCRHCRTLDFMPSVILLPAMRGRNLIFGKLLDGRKGGIYCSWFVNVHCWDMSKEICCVVDRVCSGVALQYFYAGRDGCGLAT
jgi:hypothetical protein